MGTAKEFKTIECGGGLVSFRLPQDWMEEYEESGGGTFFAPEDDSVVLRLDVFSMRSPRELRAGDCGSVFAGMDSFASGVVSPVGKDQAICVVPPQRVEGDDAAIDFHVWSVARVVAPRLVRLAGFTASAAVGLEDQAQIDDTIAMLLDQVKACVVSQAPPASPL
jgi:hypothetical protein